MQSIRRVLFAVAAVLSCAAPAFAQSMGSSADMTGGGDSKLLFVWVWILVLGIVIFIAGTSMGVRSGRN